MVIWISRYTRYGIAGNGDWEVKDRFCIKKYGEVDMREFRAGSIVSGPLKQYIE